MTTKKTRKQMIDYTIDVERAGQLQDQIERLKTELDILKDNLKDHALTTGNYVVESAHYVSTISDADMTTIDEPKAWRLFDTKTLQRITKVLIGKAKAALSEEEFNKIATVEVEYAKTCKIKEKKSKAKK